MKQTILVCAAAILAVLLATHVLAGQGFPQPTPESPIEEGPSPPTPETPETPVEEGITQPAQEPAFEFTPTVGITPTVEVTPTVEAMPTVGITPTMEATPFAEPPTGTETVITQAVTTTVVVTTTTAVTRVQVITDTEPVTQLVITEAVAPARASVDLDAGYMLDPFLISVQAGGPFSAAGLGPGCTGFVTDAPTLSVNWNGSEIVPFIETFFYSDHDPILIVQTPTGQILCNDDANDVLLDPVIQIDAPASGLYHIWAGSAARNQMIPGLLVITRDAALNVGTFRPEQLVAREPIPEMVVDPALVSATELPTVTTRLAEVGVATLQPGMAPANVPVEVSGTVPAFTLPIRGAICPGYINNYIDYSFTWTGTTSNLRIFFEGNADASLLVIGPGDTVYCNDDVAGAENLNPMVTIVNPPTGTFLVYVGRINPEVVVSGMLTVVEASELLPAVLTTAP